MQPFDIFAANFPWKGCNDIRPWLIVEHLPDGEVNCLPISSQDYGQRAFRLDQLEPDFAATGLSRTCFIHDEELLRLPAASFLNRKGLLRGDLLARFLKAAGLEHLVPPENSGDT
jgi:hypothetical protein